MFLQLKEIRGPSEYNISMKGRSGIPQGLEKLITTEDLGTSERY